MTTSDFNLGRFVPQDYVVHSNGVYRNLGGKHPPKRIAMGPVYVTALLRNLEESDWTLQLEFLTLEKKRRNLLLPYASLFNYRDMNQVLGAAGLLVVPGNDGELGRYLSECVGSGQVPIYRSTGKLGFNLAPDSNCEDRLAFVLPGQTLFHSARVVPEYSEKLIFQMPIASSAFGAYVSAGSFEESHDLLRMVRGDNVAIFSLCASLAAPFLELAGVDSTILHFHGRSSTGKTTRLQLVAMLWGKPLDPQTSGNDVTLIERWHGTANSIENLATVHNGMVLCMDELGGNIDDVFSIYNHTSGRGRNRMTREGGIQAQKKWSVLSVSTGEISLSDRLEAASGKPAKTGEIIRGLSIPLDDLPAYTDMDVEKASAHIQTLKTRLRDAYGTIGPAFAQGILDYAGTATELKNKLYEGVDAYQASLIERARSLGIELEQPQVRALRRFALICLIGIWAAEGFLPFSEEEILGAIELVAMTWLKSLPTLNDEDRIVGQLRDWVIQNLGQMIRSDQSQNPGEPYLPNQTKGIRYGGYILLTDAQFAEACAGTSPFVAAGLLKRIGILHFEKAKRKARFKISSLSLPNMYYYALKVQNLLPEAERPAEEDSSPPQVPNIPMAGDDDTSMPTPRRKKQPGDDDDAATSDGHPRF